MRLKPVARLRIHLENRRPARGFRDLRRSADRDQSNSLGVFWEGGDEHHFMVVEDFVAAVDLAALFSVQVADGFGI